MSKGSKHRFCPAIGGELRPEECGAGRNSRYSCPPECPHNPLAPRNYDQLLILESGLDAKTFQWAAFEDPARDASFEGRLEDAQAGSPAHGLHAAVVWQLFYRCDASGLTSSQRWERAGFPGLNNDERVLVAAKIKMRIVLLEVRQVLDAERTEASDLLAGDGAPIRFLDRSFAASAVRFASLLGWAYPLPHFWRLSGTAIRLSELGPFSVEDVVAETIRHLGGPSEAEAKRRWLAEHFIRAEKSITATASERLRRMYLELDASWGHAVYELTAPYADCRSAIDAEPAVESADLEGSERAEGFKEVRTWFDDSAEARTQSLGQGRPLLGTIQMKEGSWKVEASSGARLDRLRKLFEDRLGQRVRFVRERRDDLGARMAGNIPVAGDSNLIPPRLLEHINAPAFTVSKMSYSLSTDPAKLTETVRQASLKTFPDEPVPMLDGRTPREAAGDPSLRKRLIALMKIHVRGVDEENLRKGAASDINPLLRELGLHEIDFPPPTRRAIPRAEAAADHDEDDAPLPPGRVPGASGPQLPPLPSSRPLTTGEAEERIRLAIDAFDLAGEALDAMAATGSTLIDDLLQVTDGLISDDDFNFLVPNLIPAWFALVPRNGPAPLIPREALRSALVRDLGSFESVRAFSAPDLLLKDHRQPALALCLMSHCMDTFVRAPKKMKPRPDAQAVIMLVLRTVINEIDRAVRG
jgi:hypothetical protein